MEKFAGYGFNKSHAAAYALVAYQTAYFKAHHPAAFMAANLSLVMDDTDKVARSTTTRSRRARDPAARHQRVGLPLRAGRREAASATASAASRAPAQQAIDAIVAARDAGGPFTRPVRLLPPRRQAGRQPARRSRRWSRAARSTRSMRAARRCSRRWASRSTRGERAEAPRRRRSRCSARTAARRVALVATREWTEAERLAHEKTALGFYLSGHPYTALRHASSRRSCALARGHRSRRHDAVLVAGIVTALRVQTSRRGKMAFVTLDDGKGRAEIDGLQRDVRRGAGAAARRPARHRRGPRHAAR